MLRTWKFAVTTPQGIYVGELTGEQEPGETDTHALAEVTRVAREFIAIYKPDAAILACFASTSEIYIDAPGTTLIGINVNANISSSGSNSTSDEKPPTYETYKGIDIFVAENVETGDKSVYFDWYGRMQLAEEEEYEQPTLKNKLNAARGAIDLLLAMKEKGHVGNDGTFKHDGN